MVRVVRLRLRFTSTLVSLNVIVSINCVMVTLGQTIAIAVERGRSGQRLGWLVERGLWSSGCWARLAHTSQSRMSSEPWNSPEAWLVGNAEGWC